MLARKLLNAGHGFVVAGLLALTACGGGNSGSTDASGDELVFYRGNGSEPDTIDPHLAQGSWENDIIGDLLVGLTTETPEGEPIPGAAESWETSDDGLTWTFHLREHQWSDGVPVTADDFVYAFRRLINPATAASYAYFIYPVLNAEAINAGQMPLTELGVEAPDDRTFVVHLEHPAPYLAEFMMHQSTFPVPRHVVEEHGNSWTRPGNYVTNGAYVPTEWIPNDHITAVKNPLFYDADNVTVDRIVYYPSSDYAAALQRFRAGELDIQSRLPSSQIDWIRRNIPEAIDLRPQMTIEYLSINFARSAFDDLRVREALSLSIDRETLINQVIRMNNPPGYSMIPPGTANYPGDVQMPYADMPQAQRLERARSLMREAGYGPDNPLSFSVAHRSASSDARRVPAAIQQMWSEAYFDAEIEQMDAAVFYARVQEHDFDVGIAAWGADFNDASNFLELLKTGNSNNYGQYSNPEYDELLELAEAEPDLQERGRLLARAEEIALRDHAWVPMYFWVTTPLVHTYIDGWVNNPQDTHRTRWIRIDEEARSAAFPGR